MANMHIGFNVLSLVCFQPLQAQPRPTLHVLLIDMQESPQALPFLHVLQQYLVLAGALSVAGVGLRVGSCCSASMSHK
jgi:hypothetical protein